MIRWFVVLLVASLSAFGQTPPPPQLAKSEAAKPDAPKPEPAKDPPEGIPVTDKLVIDKCSSCHKADDKGNLTRISWVRTTPEGWEMVLKRMVRLNGLTLKPEEARSILKSLSNSHGLAPEEAKPVMYIAERRMIDEEVPTENLRNTCVICHAIGRARSWRRTKEEWDLLGAMHVGYFPVAEFQGFRRQPPPPDAPPPAAGSDSRQPIDQAVDWLQKNCGFTSPEWSSWRARMRSPKLGGRWLISGHEPGKGKVLGEMVIEPGSAPDEFTSNITLRYLKDGSTATRSGKVVVYTGYAWRGRSSAKSPSDPKEMREVMWIAPDQSYAEGRWFWGGYEEFGIDVKLRRAGEEAVVTAVDRTMVKAGATERVRILGDRLPNVTAADIDFGSGVTVNRIVSQSPSEIAVEIAIDAKAIAGKRDVAVRRAVLANAAAVYDKVDYIKVAPETALARLGGTTHPKGLQQFEAVAYHRGADNKPRTPDDVELGYVEAEWSIEEFLAVYGDDDKDFVGTLSPKGLFTPALEGPNPKRKFSRNNYGDVWVVATYKGETGKDGKPLTAKSYLVVTIPLYVKWDTPEVAQ